jgi:hypothetical protein
LDVAAEIEEGAPLLGLDVVEMELSPLITEEEFGPAWVELQEVDLGVVTNSGQICAGVQVLHADGL